MHMERITTKLALALAFIFLAGTVRSQSELSLAQDYLRSQAEAWQLEAADLTDYRVSDQYTSGGITHIYFLQRFRGIDIYNAQAMVHLKDGKIFHGGAHFESRIAERVNTTVPLVSPEAAIRRALDQIGANGNHPAQLVARKGSNDLVYRIPDVARGEVPVRLVLLPNPNSEEIRLGWHIDIDQLRTPDFWTLVIDATDGRLLKEGNYTVYCNFHQTTHAGKGESCTHLDESAPALPLRQKTVLSGDSAVYRVFPYYVEGPIFGERELLVNPADSVASPFGWHDANGQPGAEYTFTRGNNVHAYLDLDNIDERSGAEEVDGGDSLVFDFYFENGAEVDTLRPASVTQMFYMNNFMHDMTWYYGFDEASGNFQQRNYTGEGLGNDYVMAESQDGAENAIPPTNNANFATPQDGSNGRMQMYLWDNSGSSVMRVEAPEAIAGPIETGTADFGPAVDQNPITGLAAIARDGTSQPELVCDTIVNGAEVAGKIALIRRGDCFFKEKALNAYNAGAIGVVICNPENTILNMTGPAEVETPEIPSVLVRESDCERIRLQIAAGNDVTITLQRTGPQYLDSGFDNGIVAHEYGHGISNRLVGGPSASDCLFNDEQMGEGWSDFYTLVTSVRPGDTGETPRGIGNYAAGGTPQSRGIRRFPYSTDMSINPLTYDDVILSGSAPHPLGEVWVATIWDLYWALVDEYGYDDDIYRGTGGNNMAIRLVTEGLKLTICNPGLVDGRNGILAADLAFYEGANQCLIWEVFARRGLGYLASQGTAFDRRDNRENFDVLPECLKTLKITKDASVRTINAGENFRYTLRVFNHQDEDLTGVVVRDEIPAGLTVNAGSVNVDDFTIEGQTITFTIGELPAGDDVEIRYTVTSSPDLTSTSFWFDGAENGDDNWQILPSEGADIWDFVTGNVYEGEYVWFVPNEEADNDQSLIMLDPVTLTGTRPALRFFHNYDTEPAWDGGLLLMSVNDGPWEEVGDRFIRNAYRGELAESALSIPNLNGFWGNSEGYIDSYLDLSDLAGQDLKFRWRFGSDDNTDEEGWYLDNIEFLDLFSYDGEACVTTDAGETVCARAPEAGVIVNPNIGTDAVDPRLGETAIDLFPNPAKDRVTVNVRSTDGGAAELLLLSVDGRVVARQQAQLVPGAQQFEFPVGDLPRGFYLVQVRGEREVYTRKLSLN
jgi:uncharacterized repeat protein (TIGR01451 family)